MQNLVKVVSIVGWNS